MSRLLLVLGLLPVFLSIGGCGGSSHASSSTSATATSTTTGAPASTTSTSSATSSAAGKSAGGSSNVRVPATFVIAAAGKLRPSQITVPASFAVEFTVVSGDRAAHRVVLATPTPQSLSVSAGGRTSVRVAGLRRGSYTVRVDGQADGVLIIGGQPGP